jgi:hypothetical protein
MPSDGRTSSPDSELAFLIRSRGLTYPITTKAEFVRLMTGAPSPVVFRRQRYDPGFGASLVPEFFFPATSEQDLLTKISELLISRGLLPVSFGSTAFRAARKRLSRSLTQQSAGSVKQVVDELELHIRRAPAKDVLDRQAVEALDVVGHALAFVRHPRALELWRDALWNRELVPEAREAVAAMLDFMAKAAREGRDDEISRVCDCLHVFVDGTGSHDFEDQERHDDP